MKRSLKASAEQIVKGYREVCTMTPHVPCIPEESSDNAIRLAVHYLKLADVKRRILEAYNIQNENLLKGALLDMIGDHPPPPQPELLKII